MICSIEQYSCFSEGGIPPIITSEITECSTIYPILAHTWNCTDATPSAQPLIATVSSELSTQSAQLANDVVNIISIGFAMVIFAIGVMTALKYLGGKKL